MSNAALLGYVVGLLFLIPAAALTGKYATIWIARLHVAYWKTLVATAIAYFATVLFGMLQVDGQVLLDGSGVRFVAGAIILAACNVRFLRSSTGARLSFVQAAFIAVLQAIGGVVGLFIGIFLAAGIKTLVS